MNVQLPESEIFSGFLDYPWRFLPFLSILRIMLSCTVLWCSYPHSCFEGLNVFVFFIAYAFQAVSMLVCAECK